VSQGPASTQQDSSAVRLTLNVIATARWQASGNLPRFGPDLVSPFQRPGHIWVVWSLMTSRALPALRWS